MLSVLLYGGFVVVRWLTADYAAVILAPDTDARRWAALEPRYADVATCADCHDAQAALARSATHEGIGCESCHGPLLDHALASPGTPEASVAVAVPGDDLCLTCHSRTEGRPESVRQVETELHYVPACLQCHDPHSGISNRPPVTLHPLENLPPCVTCHGPEGFKARNQRHPTVRNDDAICLACHAAGRGPAQVGPDVGIGVGDG